MAASSRIQLTIWQTIHQIYILPSPSIQTLYYIWSISYHLADNMAINKPDLYYAI